MTSEDVILAQSILDAANITLPTGNPNDGVYDGKLNQNKIKGLGWQEWEMSYSKYYGLTLFL